jgi:hypothetical protein
VCPGNLFILDKHQIFCLNCRMKTESSLSYKPHLSHSSLAASLLQKGFAGVVVALGIATATAPLAANAQGTLTAGPNGLYRVKVADPTSMIWDLSASDALKDVNLDFYHSDGEHQASFEFQAPFQQNGAGKLSAIGATSVQFGYTDDSGAWVMAPFSATYKVTGSVSSVNGKSRGTITYSVAGSAIIAGRSRRVTLSKSGTFTGDNASQTFGGTTRNRAAATGEHPLSNTSVWGPESMRDRLNSDGSWNLSLILGTSGKVIGGSGAVALNSGAALPFTVKGVYNAKTEVSKLVLTGTGAAKGSSLQVTMAGNIVSLVKGKVFGQSVNSANPAPALQN